MGAGGMATGFTDGVIMAPVAGFGGLNMPEPSSGGRKRGGGCFDRSSGATV